jgi:predicted AAA+ superfamily ATPase
MDFFTSRREMRNAISYYLNSRRDASTIYLLLDEITYLEDWNLELKFMADQGILRKGIIIATGSSAIKLKQKGELLPGRGLEGNEYYIKPLSFRKFVIHSIANDFIIHDSDGQAASSDEFTDTLNRLKSLMLSCSIDLASSIEDIRKEVDKLLPFKRELGYLFRLYLICGGMPGVINHYFTNRYQQHQDIIESTIAEIFIRDVLGDFARMYKQETTTRQILKGIVERYGSRYSFSNLSRKIERTHVTTIDYIEFMEDSFLCFVLYAYDFNKKEAKIKGDKKIYFFDPFIFHSVKSHIKGTPVWDNINRTLEDENLLGKLVEGVFISHLRMYDEIPLLRTGNTFLWNYYDKSGKEIDAIFKINGSYLGIEVKYQWQVDERDIKRIIPVKKYIILSKEDIGGRGDMMIVPLDVFLALLPSSKRNF